MDNNILFIGKFCWFFKTKLGFGRFTIINFLLCVLFQRNTKKKTDFCSKNWQKHQNSQGVFDFELCTTIIFFSVV